LALYDIGYSASWNAFHHRGTESQRTEKKGTKEQKKEQRTQNSNFASGLPISPGA
jgi:hypothetical protein